MTAVLKITDGINEVDLLGDSGYVLNSWRPAVASYKGDGVWRDSSIAEGRRLIGKVFGNTIETFDLKLAGVSQDDAILWTRKLRALLESASDYWTNARNNTPVYVIAKASRETNTRYAAVHAGKIPEDDNPFAQPFLQRSCRAAMDGITLLIERGHWLSQPPGSGECVEISGVEGGELASDSFLPSTDVGDSAWVNHTVSSIFTVFLQFGNQGGASIESGIRFRNVDIPQGVTILSAYIDMRASTTLSGATCIARIQCEDADDAAAFSTYADFNGRPKTTAYTDWNPVPAMTNGVRYDSPFFSAAVQEVVNRGGWASGNSMVVFIDDQGSSADAYRQINDESNPSYAPVLYVTYIDAMGEGGLGRAATCASEEVFIANKRNEAQLTHVFTNDVSAGTFSANLLGESLPYNLLPSPVQNGDIIYFGIDTAIPDSGPFSNLIFDIATAASYGAGDSGAWEYWSGAAWVAFTTTIYDRTAAAANQPLSESGVKSVFFDHPSTWVPNAINGITAYWIRLVVTVATGISVPTQQNRHPYTCTWPYIEIDDQQANGDINPLSHLLLHNVSQNSSAFSGSMVREYIMGLTDLAERPDFTAYINIADEQNPSGVTVADTPPDAIFGDSIYAPTGRAVIYTSSGGVDAIGNRASVTLDSAIANSFLGTFRVFVRGYIPTVAQDFELSVLATYGNNWSSTKVVTISTSGILVADLGEISIGSNFPSDQPLYIIFSIQIGCTHLAARSFHILDLILIPTDHWSASISSTIAEIGAAHNAHLNSVTYPKKLQYGYTDHYTYGYITGSLRVSARGPAILLGGKQQRLWTFGFTPTPTYTGSTPFVGNTIEMEKTVRYLSMRGED